MIVYRSDIAPEYEIPILYEDNHLLFAVKPIGVLSQEDASGKADMLSLLKDYLVQSRKKPGAAWLGLLHRLDQPVSGIMVFAKTSKAASRLSESIRCRELKKIYYAVCRGIPEPDSGRWEDRISERKINKRYQIAADGRPSALQYKVLESVTESGGLSLLRIELESGRSHQIRVQTSSRNYPLAGDRRYGIMDKLDQALASPALFAGELQLIHPVRKTRITVRAPMPEAPPWSFFTWREAISAAPAFEERKE